MPEYAKHYPSAAFSEGGSGGRNLGKDPAWCRLNTTSMAARIHTSIRSYLGGLALAAGCLGLLLLMFAIAIMALMGGLYPGFSADGAGREMSAADRSAAASERNWEIAQEQLVPLFVVSAGLIGYGFYEARMEQKRKSDSGSA